MLTDGQLQILQSSRPVSPCPRDFADFWGEVLCSVAMRQRPTLSQQQIANPQAYYRTIQFRGIDGTELSARYIHPKRGGNLPVVLAFHDYTRSVRGWHHLTRYTALGYAVIALESRSPIAELTAGVERGPLQMAFRQHYCDALVLAQLVCQLPSIDVNAIMTIGDGMGGALALAVAAIFPRNVSKCATLNPLPCDIQRVWVDNTDVGFYQGIRTYLRNQDPTHVREDGFFADLAYLDCVNFAPMLRCRLLLGTSILDKTSPPATQFSLVNEAVCEKRHLIFPKHDHELINFYDNELLKFLLA